MPSSERTTIQRALTRRTAILASGALAASAFFSIATPAPQADATTVAWGGYTNGKIPTKVLTKTSNGYLRPDAAKGYAALSKAFQAKFKKSLSLTEGFRTYATQVSIFQDRYSVSKAKTSLRWSGKYWVKKKNVSVAAIPGTSIHGWALAADFGSRVNVAKSTEKKWANKYGPTYGWRPVGDSFGEPWHFEFAPVVKKK